MAAPAALAPARAIEFRPLALLLAAAMLTACATRSPAPPAPEAGFVTPADRFIAADPDAPQPGPDDLAWWRRFDDPALAGWIERALANNLDIAQARARTEEARALLRAAQAGRAPQVGAEISVAATSRPGAQRSRRVEPTAALALDWDADLWGRLAAAEDAAQARLGATGEAQRATRLSVAALTARAFVGWREALLERAQLDAAIALQREIARVVQVRVDVGLSPALDGQRARGEVAATEADAVAATTRVRSAERALQLLAGERPGPLISADAQPQPVPRLSGTQPVIMPIDLLRIRPDVRAAELEWRAARADVEVARAAQRPSLRLPGVLTLGSAASGALLAQVSASIAQPLFDGGLRRADRDVAQARLQAAELAYRQTLQQALADVEAALRAAADSRDRMQAQQRALQEADAAVADARTLYTAGLSGFLDVLDAQRSALTRRQALLRAQGDSARAAIAGFESMGLLPE
jgi:outer membrane protein, multidrug efflux system